MSRRIFTKVFDNTVVVSGVEPATQNAFQRWLVQEDIEVIGAAIAINNRIPSENDGFASLEVELSQVGIVGEDGAILKASGSEGWNTVPQGISATNAFASVTYPQGLAVPVKEEGYLYLNLETQGKSAGMSIFSFSVIVYYTKRGA